MLSVLALLSAGQARADVALELVGEPLSGAPHFEYVRAVQMGTPVTIAFQPQPPGFADVCDVYVVAAKTAAEWDADPSLTDVRPSGPEKDELFDCDDNIACRMKLREGEGLSGDAGCLVPQDPSTCIGLGVPYDVVLDCDQDGDLGGLDLVDGRGDEAGFWVVHDTTQDRLDVTFAAVDMEVVFPGNDYRLPSCFNFGCTNDCDDERLAYPTDIAAVPGSLPLVVVSHGNGHCLAYYDYLMRHIASYGYVVMSHANNTAAPVPGEGVGGSDGTGGAAETTLKHTDAILGLLTSPSCAVLLPSHPGVCGRVDPHRIAWIGHSRGGNGIVWARTRLATDPGDPIHFDPVNYALEDIRLLSAMAPVDALVPRLVGGSTEDALADPGTTPFHLVWGGGDRDVSGVPGGSSEAFGLLERAMGPKQSLYLHGGAHGWFHDHCAAPFTGIDCGQALPVSLSENVVHAIVNGYVVPLLARYVRDSAAAVDFLRRPWNRFHAAGVPPGVEAALEYREAPGPATFVLDDFETQTSPAVSSSGGAVTQDLDPTGTDASLYLEDVFQDQDCSFAWERDDPLSVNVSNACFVNNLCLPGGLCIGGGDRGNPNGTTPCDLVGGCTFAAAQPMNGMTRSKSLGASRGVAFGWDEKDGHANHVEFAVVPGQEDFSDNEDLSFRAAQLPRHPLTRAALGDLAFSVTLRDGQDRTSTLDLASYDAGVIEPHARGGPVDVLDTTCCQGTVCVKPPGCNWRLGGEGWQAEFETVRIRLRDFLVEEPALDLSDIGAVRFELGSGEGSSAGRIALDDVEVTAPPACPAVQPCLGGCVRSGPVLDALDTGLSVCAQPSGQTMTCGSGRIHVVTRGCRKARCCTQPPLCLCLIGPCNPTSGTALECY